MGKITKIEGGVTAAKGFLVQAVWHKLSILIDWIWPWSIQIRHVSVQEPIRLT